MIQFNLLPDVKQVYIRTQRIKRLVIGISLIASAAALFTFLVLLSSVYVVQRKHMHDLAGDIQTDSKTLKDIPHLADILTVQSQLNSLSSVNAQKPAASRLFGFLSKVAPQQATISDLKIDYGQNSVTVSGNAPSLDVVNTLIDGLKFTTYTVQGQTGAKSAFSSVVLAGFSRNASSATYSVTFSFDPAIFNNANVVTLSVGPGLQSGTQQPSVIFKKGE